MKMEALIFNIQRFSLHDGGGIRTNVFFQGCNLKCAWCANPESLEPASDPLGKARRYSLDALAAELLKDKPFFDESGGGVTLTGGEPLLQSEFVLALCGALRAMGVHVCIETAANVPSDIIADAARKSDAVLIDLKHYDSEAHKRCCGADNAQIIKNIRLSIEINESTVVRIPVIPGFNNTPQDMLEFSGLLGRLAAKEVHLLPFHQFGANKYKALGRQYAFAGVPQLHDEDIEPLAAIIRAAGFKVQTGG